MTRIKAAVVGLGYWGPNLLRNLHISSDFELVGACDIDEKRLSRVGSHYPALRCYSSVDTLLQREKPDLLAIATPVASHHPLVLNGLRAGCHILCEKPLAATVREGSEIVELAGKLERRVFVDHTSTYTAAVACIRERYERGKLGSLFYIDSVRVNLGVFQPDVGVVWDLGSHDLSILQHILGAKPIQVQGTGLSHNPRKLVDVAYLNLRYASGLTAHLHLSWLSPVKIRRMIFSGASASIVYDDLELAEKVKVYDHAVHFDATAGDGGTQSVVRGDTCAPRLDDREALATEFSQIASCLRGDVSPVVTADHGLEVVKVMEAAERSIREGGLWASI